MVKFSIIITSYNYESYIVECLKSCLNQLNFTNYEIIIVDDGSQDGTKKLLSQFLDDKLSVYYLENSGIEKASNYGILKSKGEFIVRVDADDKLKDTFLFEMDEIISQSFHDFYYPNYFIIDSESSILEKINLPQFDKNEIFSRGDFLATGTVYRKDVLFEVGNYEEKVKNSGLENYELIIKLILSNYNGKLVSNQLFFYRRHQTNMSELRKKGIVEFGNKLFKRFKLGRYKTNSNHPYKLIIN